MHTTGWAAEEAPPVTMGKTAGTYSVGGAGVRAAVTSLAFRFLCLRSPRFGEMSPFVLLLAAFSARSAPRAFLGGAGALLLGSDAGGTEPAGAAPPALSVPASSLSAFPSCCVIWGCFLEFRGERTRGFPGACDFCFNT